VDRRLLLTARPDRAEVCLEPWSRVRESAFSLGETPIGAQSADHEDPMTSEATDPNEEGTNPAEAPPSETTSTLSLGGLTGAPSDEAADAPADSQDAGVDALAPGTALLVVQRGPNAGSRYLLEADVTTVGRHPDAIVFLDDVTVSRRHAMFVRDAEGFRVVDVGSLNGTYVNRRRIDDTLLSGGDEVQIGKYRLLYFPAAPRSGGVG
jgi:hypothetical protein